MKVLIFCFLLFGTVKLFGQDAKTYILYEDINGDNRNDSVQINRSDDNGTLSYEIVYKILGNLPFYVKGGCSPSNFLCAIPLPDAVDVTNVQFLAKLSDAVFGLQYQKTLPAEAQWLIDVSANMQNIRRSQVVDLKSSFPQVTTLESPMVIDGSVCVVDKKVIKKLERLWAHEPEWQLTTLKNKKFLLAYYANNHQKVLCEQAEKDTSKNICITNHGVYIRSKQFYNCVFLNDASVFGTGSEKLRWPSLRKATVYLDYVLVRTYSLTAESESLYVLNIRKGQLLRLNNDYFHVSKFDNSYIKDNVLFVDNVKIALNPLFRSIFVLK